MSEVSPEITQEIPRSSDQRCATQIIDETLVGVQGRSNIPAKELLDTLLEVRFAIDIGNIHPPSTDEPEQA